MGIAPYLAEAIIREHKFRPIRGDVLLLGRQTFRFSPTYAANMVRGLGLEPADIPLDDTAIDRQTWASEGESFIRDDVFFRLLGVPTIRALDHTNYEGADLIHDLNTPIPASLEGIADFVLDGSTLDNVFNPAQALQNIGRMLRPGGRYLGTNMGSVHYNSYTILTSNWFVDYFAVNGFVDCKVYVTVHGSRGEMSVFATNPADAVGMNFQGNEFMGIVAFAEKGESSSWAVNPSQRFYSSQDQIADYRSAAAVFSKSERPELLVSTMPKRLGLSLKQLATDNLRMRRMASKHYSLVSSDGNKTNVSAPFVFRSPLALHVARWIYSRLT
jgi:hypothetical protein